MTKKKTTNQNKTKIRGKTFSKTFIEQLYEKGWLEYNQSPYSDDARLRIGLKLMFNYQILSRANLHSGYIFNDRIDISTSLQCKMYNDALDFYRKCLRSVPAEFWDIVRQVCLEEKMPTISPNLSERQISHITYMYRIDLCRGLDRIISSTTKS